VMGLYRFSYIDTLSIFVNPKYRRCRHTRYNLFDFWCFSCAMSSLNADMSSLTHIA